MSVAQKRDRMGADELAEESGPLYETGRPYLWVLSYGWCIVGFYVRHETPLRIRVAHASYYASAGKPHAQMAREGAGPDIKWRYAGREEISAPHVLHVMEYHAEVHRGAVRLR